jgi:hypothetical protein
MVEVAVTTFCLAASEDARSKVLVVRGENRGFDGTRPEPGGDWPRMPLVGGLQRFARLKPVFADKMLPAYVPQSYRL